MAKQRRIQRWVFLAASLLVQAAAALELGSPLGYSSPQPFNVIVVGGSSGMGKALAKVVVARGGRALLASRSAEKLAAAATEVREEVAAAAAAAASLDGRADDRSGAVETAVLDATDETAVAAFAATLEPGAWGGLAVTCAGRAPHGPVAALETAATRDLMETKFWSAYHCAKHVAPALAKGGAVCFTAGVLNRRPGLNCAPLAVTNGALEGLTRALALELGPALRVNCLSPGFCDTERFDHLDPEKRRAMLANTAESLPLRRVGRPADMGEALYYLLTAPFCTGIVLDCDGGHGIRQYANKDTDPMRAPKKPEARGVSE